MTAQFRKIQDRTAGLTGVRLLSLTVDPDHDTPAVLEEYSKRFGADPKRWHFLTGDKAELEKLSDDTFHLNKIGAPGLDHSTRFVLVDRKGRIRGFYDSTDSGVIDQVAEDIRKLETEVF
jgi:protein SCO1/2